MNGSLYHALLTLLEGDSTMLNTLAEHGIIPQKRDEYLPRHLEDARVAQVLFRELEVNWEGVEVILHLRHELLETRQKMAQLVDLVRDSYASAYTSDGDVLS